MAALICGSLAYDNLSQFNGHFHEHILPDQLHILNVSFLTSNLRRELGGCAGNVAYALFCLGNAPYVMATLGSYDAEFYLQHFNKMLLDKTYLKIISKQHTAQANITTDFDNNQITLFHPGAMDFSQENVIDESVLKKNITLGIVAPDSYLGMVSHAQQLANLNIPFIFDPGQGLPLFNKDNLLSTLNLASYLTVNDYEAELISQRTGLSINQMAEQVETLIITCGSQGAWLYRKNQKHHIPAITCHSIVDPTGCGDAFRGGLIYGMQNQFDWITTIRLSHLMGAIKIESQGAQNYMANQPSIYELFHQHFGYYLH